MNTITAQDLYDIMKRTNAVCIDVRSEREFAKVHAERFINIPIDEIVQDIRRIPETDAVYFMCHSGGRSFLATKLAVERGINATNIDGGFSAWQKAGLPVEEVLQNF